MIRPLFSVSESVIMDRFNNSLGNIETPSSIIWRDIEFISLSDIEATIQSLLANSLIPIKL